MKRLLKFKQTIHSFRGCGRTLFYLQNNLSLRRCELCLLLPLLITLNSSLVNSICHVTGFLHSWGPAHSFFHHCTRPKTISFFQMVMMEPTSQLPIVNPQPSFDITNSNNKKKKKKKKMAGLALLQLYRKDRLVIFIFPLHLLLTRSRVQNIQKI